MHDGFPEQKKSIINFVGYSSGSSRLGILASSIKICVSLQYDCSVSLSHSSLMIMRNSTRLSSHSSIMAIFTVKHLSRCIGKSLPKSLRDTLENGSDSAVRVCQVCGDALGIEEIQTFSALHQFTLPPSVSVHICNVSWKSIFTLSAESLCEPERKSQGVISAGRFAIPRSLYTCKNSRSGCNLQASADI